MKRLLPLLLLAACAPEEPVDQPPQDPIVVYAAFGEDAELTRLFEQFKEETGIAVINRHGAPQVIVDDLIRNDVVPPADVLMTHSVVDAWRAAEESGLRPHFADSITAAVPPWARDADNLWFATSADTAVIAYNPGEYSDAIAQSFAALAESTHSGKLCLPSSATAISRTVIALLISASSVRDAELAVRAWKQNLALPPFASEAELAAAIADGRCGIGIMSRSEAESVSGLDFYQPAVTIATIDAIGIGRHARNPDGAARFVEWLLSTRPAIGVNDATVQDASIAAFNDDEARKLAERARFY